MVCIVGKMAQDVGVVCESVVVSFPSSLVGFWGFQPYMGLFSFRKLFCDLLLHVVLFFFLGMEERLEGGGGRGEDAWSVKYESIELCCSQRTKNLEMFPSEIANPNIKNLYLRGFRSPNSAKHMGFMRLCMRAYKSHRSLRCGVKPI